MRQQRGRMITEERILKEKDVRKTKRRGERWKKEKLMKRIKE